MTEPEQSIPTPPPGRRLRARDGVLVVLLALALLVLFKGSSIRASAEEMQPGVERDVVLAVGRPAGWVADRLPFNEVGNEATSLVSAEGDVGAGGGFGAPAESAGGGVQPVSPDAFDPAELGERPKRAGPLRTLLVTGDSMAMPLDTDVAKRIVGKGVRVVRDPHLGTGVSKTGFVDWGKLSARQEEKEDPDAVVVFIGANEGFDMPGPGGKRVRCCGVAWAAVYASRVRRMMSTYRRDGTARVYWLTLPFPRDHDRQEVARAVNAAIRVAAVPYGAQVRVLDMAPIFTPGGRYRASMEVDGRDRIVREPDGIHLNQAGSQVAADRVVEAVRRDFGD